MNETGLKCVSLQIFIARLLVNRAFRLARDSTHEHTRWPKK